MEILKDYDLTELNTFHIKAKAKFFVEVKNEKDLVKLFLTPMFQESEKLFLGGGSNILFTQDFPGIVILNKLKGIEILEDDSETVLVKSLGGEWWNDLVNFTVERGFWGIENLSLIPGTVGATPVQNIGAYGVELKDVLQNVEAYEIATGEKKIFSCAECKLGYRDSIFKRELKGKYFISAVTLKLNKNENENLRYKTLKDYIEKNNLIIKNPKDISRAVAEIRRGKLPDPKILGNAGSFFKNVYISEVDFKNILMSYPEMPYFLEDLPSETVDGKLEGVIKIPSGWLIEQCGPRHGGGSWKGYREGNVGVHERQALVLVNYGGATGEEIKKLAYQIIDSVYQKFGLRLTPEVNFV